MKVHSCIDPTQKKLNETKKSRRETDSWIPVAKYDHITGEVTGWYLFTKANLVRGYDQAKRNKEDLKNLEFVRPVVKKHSVTIYSLICTLCLALGYCIHYFM